MFTLVFIRLIDRSIDGSGSNGSDSDKDNYNGNNNSNNNNNQSRKFWSQFMQIGYIWCTNTSTITLFFSCQNQRTFLHNGKRKDVDKFKTFKRTSVEETKELSACKCYKFGKHYILFRLNRCCLLIS